MAETNYSAVDFSQLSATDDGKTLLYKDEQLCKSEKSISELISDRIDDKGYITSAVEELTNFYDKETINEKFADFGGFVLADPTGEDDHPDVDNPDVKKIYLVKKGTKKDKYCEWIWTKEEGSSENTWVLIGETTVNLSDYAKTADVNAELALKEDKIFIAEYNVTPYADIKDAYDDGKQIICKFYEDKVQWPEFVRLLRLSQYLPMGNCFYFDALTNESANIYVRCGYYSDDTHWSYSNNGFYTKTETSGSQQLTNAFNAKQDTLTFAGENNIISTINTSAVGQTLTAGTDLVINNGVIGVNTNGSVGNSAKMSFVAGSGTYASGIGAAAFGVKTSALGDYSHAEGSGTTAIGIASHAGGISAIASGEGSFAYGYQTSAKGDYTFAIGKNNLAEGNYSYCEGYKTKALGYLDHAEGNETEATGGMSHAEGYLTKAYGIYSHAEGESTSAIGNRSHSEGYYTSAQGHYSHAEGGETSADGSYTHAEGYKTRTVGYYSHAEGGNTIAAGEYSHAEGDSTTATGTYTHAEGCQTIAEGSYSHTEGSHTSARGYNSHAEGFYTTAWGDYSHVGGQYTIAGSNMFAYGKYNKTSADAAFVIGNGGWDSTLETNVRSDAFIVDWDGKASATKLATSGIADIETAITSINGIPASTSADEGKVLTVDSSGDAAWAPASSVLEFDEVPTEGSHNLVDSDAVAEAISNIGKPLKLIGTATVSELNGTIQGLEPGWTYTLTNSGTLTAGSVKVEVGDEVAWGADGNWVKIGSETAKVKILYGSSGNPPVITFADMIATISKGYYVILDIEDTFYPFIGSDNLKPMFSNGTDKYTLGFTNTWSKTAVDYDKVKDTAIAPEYDATSTYDVDDVVMHGGLRYVCNTAIATAEEWDNSHWTSQSVQTAMDSLGSDVEIVNVDDYAPNTSDLFDYLSTLYSAGKTAILRYNYAMYNSDYTVGYALGWSPYGSLYEIKAFSNVYAGTVNILTINSSGYSFEQQYVGRLTELTDATESDLNNNAISMGDNVVRKLTLTSISTLTVNIGSVGNFALEIDNTGNSNDVTVSVVRSGTTTLKYSVAGGNVVGAGKYVQVTCVGNCWTQAEFTQPTP